MTPGDEKTGRRRDDALLSWIDQSSPFGVATLDNAFRVQSWNQWLALHSSLKPSDVLGKNLFELYPDLKERGLVPRFERALLGEPAVLSTALHGYLLPLPPTFQDAGCPLMLQTAHISPLFSEEKICGLVLVIDDVSERERQAQILAREHRRKELLSWALAQLLETDQPRTKVRQFFFKIAEQLDFDTFLIYLRDPNSGQLRLDAMGGIPLELEADFASCPFLPFLEPSSRKMTILNSVSERTEPEFALLKKARISAAALVSLFAHDQNFGLLCFTTATRHSVQEDEAALVETIAQYLATALDRENANLLLRKAKEELSHHAQSLELRVQERTARLQESISELETFSYTIAHDLRAPVRGITGYCHILFEDHGQALSPAVKAILDKIARTSARMESLTRDLLEFSKVSQQEIALGPVQLEPVIEGVVSQRASEMRQAIIVRSPLLAVRAHQGLLESVFSNLIENALKFVPPNASPHITISTELVPAGSPNTRSHPLMFSSKDLQPQSAAPHSLSPNQVRIWVQDQGIGIPPEVHQKIFGIFERAVNPDRYQGTGIGLAIVARAMQRMGGTCGVESELGKGSRFWLDLPAA